MPKQLIRCWWPGDDPLYQHYHDTEWGVPVKDDRKLFEFIVLEGAQAGLSWITVLKKRAAFRAAFADFDVQKVARFNERKVQSLLKNPGIIRNALKIRSAIGNARAFIDVQEEFGSFSDYIWDFVDHTPVQNRFRDKTEVPATTALAERLSKDLKKRGFTFVGPTIVYAHMQATGMVNDHTTDCFRHRQVRELG